MGKPFPTRKLFLLISSDPVLPLPPSFSHMKTWVPERRDLLDNEPGVLFVFPNPASSWDRSEVGLRTGRRGGHTSEARLTLVAPKGHFRKSTWNSRLFRPEKGLSGLCRQFLPLYREAQNRGS